MCTGLEINFDEADYSTDEGDIMGLSGISLSLRETQASFIMELIPVTVDVVKTQYDLTNFLTLDVIEEDQKALSGDIFMGILLCNMLHTVLLNKGQSQF